MINALLEASNREINFKRQRRERRGERQMANDNLFSSTAVPWESRFTIRQRNNSQQNDKIVIE